jgi:vancomycin aglycone glucosyltransferase
MPQKKVLISTIGSRGEVQPVLALAIEIKALGHHPILCVPPDFKEWVESFGIECVTLGPDVRKFVRTTADTKRAKPTRAQIRQMVRGSVDEQFRVMTEAARGCDLVVVAGDLIHAGRSIADSLNVPYIHAIYCPVTLKSADHPPPTLGMVGHSQRLPGWINRILWKAGERHWNGLYREALNEHRATLGLTPVRNVPAHIATQNPWLAVDSAIAPFNASKKMRVTSTGAWFLKDDRPLPDALERFLAAGPAPIYFGFGSMGAKASASRTLIEAARALGRRAVISQGWGNLEAIDSKSDCIAIGDVSHENLFPRVAAIVHHGGAGTTTAAARAGKPQVIVPHLYDQYYWAHRVQRLGVGVSPGKVSQLTGDKLIAALRQCLRPEVAVCAVELASRIETRGAQNAAQRLMLHHDVTSAITANRIGPPGTIASNG